MDAERFDRMTKLLTTGRDRRTVLKRTGGRVLASVLGLLGTPGLTDLVIRDVAAQTRLSGLRIQLRRRHRPTLLFWPLPAQAGNAQEGLSQAERLCPDAVQALFRRRGKDSALRPGPGHGLHVRPDGGRLPSLY